MSTNSGAVPMDLDEFLEYESRASGQSQFLKNWKKRNPPVIDTWLHTRAPIVALWQHNVPRLVERVDEDGKRTLHAWGGQWNCFSGETEFWADGRLVALRDVVSETVDVLSKDGVWRPAKVSAFGEQSLRSFVLRPLGRSNFRMRFDATSDHRWFTSNRGEVTDLQVGDRVLVEPREVLTEHPNFERGFVHGFVFGDGTRLPAADRYQLRLCGERKGAYQSRLERDARHTTTCNPPSCGGDPVLHFASDEDLKRLPPEGVSFDYQAGFLSGWLAADGDSVGNHGSPSRRLHSTDAAALDWVAERAPLLGFTVTGIGQDGSIETNYGKRNHPMRWLCLHPEPKEYKVEAVIDEGRREEVYCVTEPETGSFTLAGGVVTGNCWETDEVNKRRYYRDDDTDEREMPPVICPMCLLLERIRSLVGTGEVSLVDPLFRWDGDEDERVLHAGGMYGLFGSDKQLTADDKRDMKKAGIKGSEAWRENCFPKCNFVFTIVDDAEVADGIQIGNETTLLGDKVRELIRNTKTALGVEEGNPLRHPYAIRWEHHPNAKAFNDKYKAIRMEKLKLSEKVRELIVDTDPPDLTGVIRRGNVADLRTSLENAYIGPDGLIDFGEIFARAEAESTEEDEQRADEIADDTEAAEKAAKAKPAAKPRATKAKRKAAPKKTEAPPEPEPPADDDVELFDCDECKSVMRADETVCSSCGHDYGDPEPPPPPPPPTRRRRSAAAGKGKAGRSPKKDGVTI